MSSPLNEGVVGYAADGVLAAGGGMNGYKGSQHSRSGDSLAQTS